LPGDSDCTIAQFHVKIKSSYRHPREEIQVTKIIDARYERSLWQKSIKNIFPSMPRSLRTRHVILARINRTRKLRNRVFHYEPIWHFEDFEKRHDEILETIMWISPDVETLVRSKDRFQEIFLRNPN